MKRTMFLLIVSSLIMPLSARAQSRLYTNADLGKPLAITRTPTAEEMQGLRARQFTLAPKDDQPQTIVLPFDPTWPFTFSQRLEPDPWRMPAGLPLYGTWPFYGNYALNPFGIYPRPCTFATCFGTKSPIRNGTRVPADVHRGYRRSQRP